MSNVSLTYLALDGPRNGEYINVFEAMANGYTLDDWQEGEQAWYHSSSPKTDEEAFPSFSDGGAVPVDQSVPAEHR